MNNGCTRLSASATLQRCRYTIIVIARNQVMGKGNNSQKDDKKNKKVKKEVKKPEAKSGAKR